MIRSVVRVLVEQFALDYRVNGLAAISRGMCCRVVLVNISLPTELGESHRLP